MMMNTRSNRPWADLPQELLLIIANFLTSNPIDILTFRAICKSWNSASPPFSPFNLSPVLPLTCTSRLPYKDMGFDHPISIPGRPLFSVTAIFAVCQKRFSNMEQDKKCWLMFVDQLTPGKLMIRQPLTKYHYSIPLNFPSGLDVPNIHVDEIARFYNLSFHPEMNRPPSMWSEHVQKVVANCDESKAFVLFHTGRVGSLNLMMDPYWYADGWDRVSEFGINTVAYSIVRTLESIDDIIYHKGKLLGVDDVGRVHVRHFPSSTNKTIVSPITGSCTKRKRLVESNGLIYLVVREQKYEAFCFKVFELDEDVDVWVEVSSVGDMVFFFGLDFSFSISTQKLGGSFRKNCIVFIEHSFKDYDDGIVDDVLLFSNLSYGDLRVGVWHMEDTYHCGTIGSYPGYSNVLWPPPSWLWSVDMCKRIEDLEVVIDDLHMDAPAENLKVSINEAKEIHQRLESMKSKNAVSKQPPCQSINVHDRGGASSSGSTKEWKGSVNSEADDVYVSIEMKINGMLLNLEEIATKLQNALKSRQQCPPADVVE